MIGNTLDNYEITHELARGGMATVYLARDRRSGRQVVVKALPSQFTHDVNFRGRFAREAKVLGSLQHPAIVPILGYGEANETPYIAMPYLAGGSLAQRIARGPLSRQLAVQVMRPIAAALDYAHQQGVVHRDVKPSNILFDNEGNSYLTDFGIVELAEATQSFTGSAVIGTPAYISPEQVRAGTPIDGRADIYSLAVVAYEMLSGRVPYDGETPTQQYMQHVLEPVPRIRQHDAAALPAVEAILMKALAKAPDDRYGSAAEFVDALDRLIAPPLPTVYATTVAEGSSAPTEVYAGSAAPLTPARRRALPIFLIGGVAALLLLFLCGGGTVLAAALGWGPFAPPTPSPVPIAEVVVTSTPAPTTLTAEPLPAADTPTPLVQVTALPEATETPTATPPPTDTPVPPTNTPVPLTNTPIPPTNTPVPPPTNTPVPPTPTFTPVPPTDTPTNTPLPPTDTPTATPVMDSSLLVFVFWDKNRNGFHDDGGEGPLIAVVEMRAESCGGPALETTATFLGGAKFVDLAAGSYCITVIANSVDIGLPNCTPIATNVNPRTFFVFANQDKEVIDDGFGFDCQ